MLLQLSELKPDPQSVTPLYIQLANKLAEAAHGGLWRVEEPLPSERVLSEALGISRVTARKAIGILCERGLLLRKRGSGTYVAPKPDQPLTRMSNFSEELRQRGFAPGSKWLSRETGVAATEEILALALSPHTIVSRFRRLRTAGNMVVAIEDSSIPVQYIPDPQAVGNTLYGYLGARNFLPVRAVQHIRAINAAAEHALLVNIKAGEAMLYITRVGYLENGVPIELTRSFCRSDYYDFVTELHR